MDTNSSVSYLTTAARVNGEPSSDVEQRSVRAATTLARVAQLVASGLTLDEILGRVQSVMIQVMPVTRLAVLQINALERDTLLIYPRQLALDAARRAMFKATADTIVQTRAPFVVPPDQPPNSPEAHLLAVPLIRQGDVNGALVVEFSPAPAQPDGEDVSLVADIAMQVALLLERERAVEEARRRMDQMAAFSAVTSTVNEWVDVEQLARRFLNVFLNTTSTNYGLFYLLESDEHLRLLAQYGIPPELSECFRMGHLSLHPDLKRVISRGQMLVLNGLDQNDTESGMPELTNLLPVQGVAILPLRVKGRGIGAVVLGKTEGAIEIADQEFLQGLADQAAQAIENARLFAESQRRFEEQSALRELAQRFLSAVTPEEVIERTLDTLSSLLPGDFYEILLPDNEGSFALVNGRGWRRGVVGRTHTVSDPHLHAGYVLRAQSPVIVENFVYETRFQPADYLMRHQVVAAVCAPMLAETRVIGLLGVYSRAPRQFTEEQSHFLYLVATQTAMALEKARHSQAAQRRLDELILVNDVIVAANSEMALDRVLENVTNEIGELLQSEQVQIYFIHSFGELTELRPALTTPAHRWDATWSRTVANWVIQNGQSLLVPDLARDVRFNSVAHEARSCLAVPMTILERAIGVIAVAHPEPNEFDSNDRRLLTTLAGQIAAAIERARLLDETGRRLAEISAMFDFSNELRTAVTEENLLELVVRDAVTMLQGAGGSLQLVDSEDQKLHVVAEHNLTYRSPILSSEQGSLSWQVFRQGESVAVADLGKDPRVSKPETVEGLHGGIVAPLRTPSGRLGTLFVGFAEPGTPSQDKVRLATTIANLSAQALQRLRLNEQFVEQADFLAQALGELQESYQATLLALSAALDARDRETEGHSQRVTKWALAIGRQLNLSPQEVTNLERGALLHDVGKIGISDNILLKAGPLTSSERSLMNQHPRLGYDMLKGIPFLQEALPVVLYHQEMYDGSGYPSGLVGDEIPLGARIFAVADTYDAMTSTRPYRRALSHSRALDEIVRCRGTQFDPKVVDAFVALFHDKEQEPR